MANNSKVANKVCLIVIDGWGVSDDSYGNAIMNAKTPVMDKLCSGNWQKIEAYGLHVGLPDGLMGNSEVGHLNIGAGRVIYQDIVRINMTVDKNAFPQNENFLDAVNRVKAGNGRLHLLGLISDGGVHSHINHLFSMLKAAKALGVPHTYVHFFGDGRDTLPHSGITFLKQLQDFMAAESYGELATIVGRYYAMDRDTRWERIRVAYEALLAGKGEVATADKAQEIVQQRYDKGQTDEFLEPIVFGEDARIRSDDTAIFFNYRADRMREIVEAIGMTKDAEMKTEVPHPTNLAVVGMTQYKAQFPFKSLFPPVSHVNVLAETLSSQGVSQFHCAETEKYAHVTFFFNGGKEAIFENEHRGLVPSPKVATYDLLPEMSSAGVADELIKQIELGEHPFVMCNFANPDMVGHTGEYEPCIRACEATDVAIGRVLEACNAHNYILMVTADHGNAEQMITPSGGKFTAHTCNPVPFTCSSDKFVFKKSLPDRLMALRDVAPTVLDIMNLTIPKEMDGVSIVDKL
uniref:Phosphoglycerate mutase (2,3-diphosphoglycerate-independent) n=1 Tax=Rhabditophanes sp. KR3021 TaxID=114890 RepID=A0AC35UAN5_9BILA